MYHIRDEIRLRSSQFSVKQWLQFSRKESDLINKAKRAIFDNFNLCTVNVGLCSATFFFFLSTSAV